MILLTGATGLVGRHLLTRLVKDNQPVKALFHSTEKRDKVLADLPLTTIEKAKITWHQADLTDIPALEDAFDHITCIYHCAGLVSFDVRDHERLRKVNIEGTANLVNIALAKNVKRFCHLSSVATLGSEPLNRPISESSPRNNDKTYTYYAISKYGAEMEVWRASQEGLSVIIVNPAIIIGPGNWHSGSGQLFSRVANEFPFRIPRVSGFIGVEDVVEIMIQLTQSDLKNERFIAVNNMQSIAELTDQIAKALEVKPAHRPLKKWMVRGIWVLQRTGRLLFNTRQEVTRLSFKMFKEQINYDNSKLLNTIDFQYTPLCESIKKTAQAYQREHSPKS